MRRIHAFLTRSHGDHGEKHRVPSAMDGCVDALMRRIYAFLTRSHGDHGEKHRVPCEMKM